MNKKFLSMVLALSVVLNGCAVKNNNSKNSITEETLVEVSDDFEIVDKSEYYSFLESVPFKREITISAIGDCTLGYDSNFGYSNSFDDVFNRNDRDYSYFFNGVFDVISNDDLTIANLETTLTDATERAVKKFNFRCDKDYVNILASGSIEAVNLANNHTLDYLEKGYEDTKEVLDEAGIPYFGYDNYVIYNVYGIKIGLAGVLGWNEESAKNNTKKATEYFKENGVNLIIMTYHWGNEYEYKQNSTQENIARFAIDNGADLVIGHHPHILQGIEEYNGKYIVYSLGNFVFGGNKNPKDKDTMIFQETFCFEDGVLVDTNINIVPCALSGECNLNDYSPVILDEEESSRVLKKIINNSTNFDY